MVYGGYDIATVLGNIEDIAFYRIGWTRVTRLHMYACVHTYKMHVQLFMHYSITIM